MHTPLSDARPTLGALHGTYLAKVVSVDDPDGLTRVQIRLHNTPQDIADGDAAIWARVAMPFAGNDRGAFFLPDVGEEVAVVFAGGDPRQPIVMGALLHGGITAPEQLGGSGDAVDRYTIKGKKGSRIAIVEETDGQATISLTTPGGVSVTLNEASGGKVELKAAGNTVTLDTQGVSVQSSLKVTVKATQVEVNAPQVTVNAAISKFSGMVKCDVVQATTVIGSTYTPGAGNVW
ncbi:phage baseplate assembly protein V [Sorangium sp. So ce388]|uniref:phage baseplate assembly protein V n=1 Tax=Sorangium sp. So ce388 TaxID=3133309 RepID=UPI003F5B5A95